MINQSVRDMHSIGTFVFVIVIACRHRLILLQRSSGGRERKIPVAFFRFTGRAEVNPV